VSAEIIRFYADLKGNTMMRVYSTEAIKNIRSNIPLAITIVLLFTMLIQILSYSFAWITYVYWSDLVYDSGIKNEMYIEYSVYSLRNTHSGNWGEVFKREKTQIDPENPQNKIIIPLTDEEKAYNDSVIASYNVLKEKLDKIDGIIFAYRHWGVLKSDNGNAFPISMSAAQGQNYAENKAAMMFFTDMGYTEEEISQFCDYNCVYIGVDTLLMEGLTYCDGEGFTEENLNYDYVITEDGTLPTIPVVMGYDFREYYNIGDVISNPEGPYQAQKKKEGKVATDIYDQTFGRYVIVGFLNKDTSLEFGAGVRKNVDAYIVCPMVPTTPEYFPGINEKNYINEFYQNLQNYLIYIDKEYESSAVPALAKALSEDTAMGTYYEVQNNEQANAAYKQVYRKRSMNYGIIAGSTLIFCVAVIMIIIVNKINGVKKDIAIHRLVGATSGDVVRAYVLEFAIYLLCADILSHYVYIIYAFDRTSSALIGFWMTLPVFGNQIRMIYPLMLVMNIVFLAIVALMAYISSSKLNTAEIIKGKE
jgi:hypothetical protein